MKEMYNKSLHWIFTPLRCVKTSEFSRYAYVMKIEEIQKDYQKSVKEAIRLLEENFGNNFLSMYLSGSIIYQELIPFVSDIDGYMFLKKSTSNDNLICKKISEKLEEKYPFIKGFHINIITPEFIRKEYWCRFILKYNSKRIYGIDIYEKIIPDLADEVKPSKNYAKSRLNFVRDSFLPMLEGYAPKNIFPIPLSPKLFVRKICQNVFIIEGAHLLMSDNSFVGFDRTTVIDRLKETYPKWLYLYNEVNDIISKPNEINIMPDEYVEKIKDYINWLINKIINS